MSTQPGREALSCAAAMGSMGTASAATSVTSCPSKQMVWWVGGWVGSLVGGCASIEGGSIPVRGRTSRRSSRRGSDAHAVSQQGGIASPLPPHHLVGQLGHAGHAEEVRLASLDCEVLVRAACSLIKGGEQAGGRPIRARVVVAGNGRQEFGSLFWESSTVGRPGLAASGGDLVARRAPVAGPRMDRQWHDKRAWTAVPPVSKYAPH